MRYGLSLPSLLTLGALGLAACGERATEPNTAVDQPNGPQLAVASNTWITRANMPRVQTGPTVAVLGNGSGKSVVYAIAGSNTGIVQAYDVSTNTWSSKADYPDEVWLTNGAGVIGGKIYVSGGVIGDEYESRSLYRYNPTTNVWTRKHDLPAPSYYGITGVIGERLYVLTGLCVWVSVCPDGKGFWRYDPATDNWTSLPTPPSGHAGGAGAVIAGKFYVVGGGPVDDPAGKELDIFDPATNRWTTLPGLTGIRHNAASAALGGKLYVIGGRGYDPTSSQPDVLLFSVKVYDPGTKQWTTAQHLPHETGWGLRAAGKVMVNGQARIELVGGPRPNNLQYIP
jgi:N-acetylneuraminic acid mutarotase